MTIRPMCPWGFRSQFLRRSSPDLRDHVVTLLVNDRDTRVLSKPEACPFDVTSSSLSKNLGTEVCELKLELCSPQLIHATIGQEPDVVPDVHGNLVPLEVHHNALMTRQLISEPQDASVLDLMLRKSFPTPGCCFGAGGVSLTANLEVNGLYTGISSPSSEESWTMRAMSKFATKQYSQLMTRLTDHSE